MVGTVNALTMLWLQSLLLLASSFNDQQISVLPWAATNAISDRNSPW